MLYVAVSIDILFSTGKLPLPHDTEKTETAANTVAINIDVNIFFIFIPCRCECFVNSARKLSARLPQRPSCRTFLFAHE